MAPPVAALAKSESKQKLFRRLNLVLGSRRDEELYDMMREEVLMGCRRMEAEHESLSKGRTRLSAPYNPALANETTKHREILRIYALARPETRKIYDLGHYTDSYNVENWIIRWMMWHVSRYIEIQLQTQQKKIGESIRVDPADMRADIPTVRKTSYFWDPVRNG